MGGDKTIVAVVGLCVILGMSVAEGYRNYTVGDDFGWSENPKLDYQTWAANYTFSLGDFLIFNTDNNHSVVQTYNSTIYKLCDDADAADNDTIEWSSADPSSTAPHPVSVPVQLRKVGTTYFFSGDYDGEQCRSGQRMMINVTYGQGLPWSPDDSPAPVGAQSGDDAAPETIVPYNFDHPRDIGDDDDENVASNSVVFWPCFAAHLNLLLLFVVGFLFYF
ncbi:blue copper protein 1b-like [Andrographis paniculata]|uniref:blue copper protein 1b-like n=1 Tax=Andrographis paniculata TaxID=175694 RepID=UPI0021E7CC72|nr:blue copper protein 1b-like [Andrographis paniculata]